MLQKTGRDKQFVKKESQVSEVVFQPSISFLDRIITILRATDLYFLGYLHLVHFYMLVST